MLTDGEAEIVRHISLINEGLTGCSEPIRNKAKVKIEASESNFANTLLL